MRIQLSLYDAVADGIRPDTPVTNLFTRDAITFYDNMSYDQFAKLVRASRIGTGQGGC